jgi:hypothetical protein
MLSLKQPPIELTGIEPFRTGVLLITRLILLSLMVLAGCETSWRLVGLIRP